VPARVHGEDDVAVRREVRLGDGVHRAAVLSEAVERENGRPAARGRRAVGRVKRRGQRDAVAHRQPVIRLGVGVRGARRESEEDCDEQEKSATHGERG
jgi:hypothetical protein